MLFLFQYFSKYRVKGAIWSWPSIFSVIIGINLLYFTPCDGADIAYCGGGCYNGVCSRKSGIEERRSINVNVGMGGEGRNVNFVGGKVNLTRYLNL